ncbi:MAG TPA: hypothetical protein VGR37_21790, partial [Longimicrobiaceae bacterium]|nr:hypothetical protein [Longimicrobiaceae bacterium]
IYTAYSKQKVAAESLFYQAGLRADAARIIGQHLAAGGHVSNLAAEVGRIRDGLAAIRSDYANYPLLHYFVSSRPEQSLTRLLFVAQDLALLLDTAVDPDECIGVAELGTRSGLIHAAAAVQDGVAETLIRGGPDRVETGDPSPGDQVRWRARFDSARAVLRESGVPVREDAAAAEEYVRRRGEWEPVLRESARRLGEDWAEVIGRA